MAVRAEQRLRLRGVIPAEIDGLAHLGERVGECLARFLHAEGRQLGQRILDQAGGSAEKFMAALKDLSASQAQANLRGVEAALKSVREEADAFIGSWTEIQARRSAFNIFTGTSGAHQPIISDCSMPNASQAFHN